MRWVVNATPRSLYLRERPGTHCIRKRFGKFLPLRHGAQYQEDRNENHACILGVRARGIQKYMFMF